MLPGNGGNNVPDGASGTYTLAFHGGQKAIPDLVPGEDQIDPSGFFGSDADLAFLTLLDDLTGAAGVVSTIDSGGGMLTLTGIRDSL